MCRRILALFLALGVVLGYGSAIAELVHHGLPQHGCPHAHEAPPPP